MTARTTISGTNRVDMARAVNKFTAEVVKDDPSRFSLFATVTQSDVHADLAEIVYAYDEPRANGVVLMSNVERRYLGAATLEPLWTELARSTRRSARRPSTPG